MVGAAVIRKVAAAVLLVVTALLSLAWVLSPIEPIAWTPPPRAELVGAYVPNDRLQPIEWWAKQLIGPEAITINPDGSLLAGLKDGRIVKLKVGVDEPEVLADTKGRPLAMEYHPDGRLIICDAHAGLLAMDSSGKLETLATGHGGTPFKFVDDLIIAKDGTIYFTDASSRNSIEKFTEELLEHQATGRLLKYVPATKELTRLADGFSFANGVAMAEDESFLVVAETGTYQLWRVWLTGAKAGRKELFTDSLPGFPDNVRWSPSRKGFWVAIGSPRKPELDLIADWPNIRRIVGGLPKFLQPKAARVSYVLLVDLEGKPVESFQHDASDSYSPIACVTEHEGYLYLGSFAREGVARFKLP
jgi:sugar lactone lactonase YvrE